MECEAARKVAAEARDHPDFGACAEHCRARPGGTVPIASRLSRDAALALLRAPRPQETAGCWPCRVGPVTMRFPDFAWRRLALRAHDLHHDMTGYPMTLRGEFQMAAWEFAAGRYPHWGATLFCAPLLLLGLICSPAAMVRAWRRGRQS